MAITCDRFHDTVHIFFQQNIVLATQHHSSQRDNEEKQLSALKTVTAQQDGHVNLVERAIFGSIEEDKTSQLQRELYSS